MDMGRRASNGSAVSDIKGERDSNPERLVTPVVKPLAVVESGVHDGLRGGGLGEGEVPRHVVEASGPSEQLEESMGEVG